MRLVPDGVLGTARGAGEGDPLVVDTGLDGDTVLEPGGALTTSGADRSAFPPPIPVGTVRGTKEAGGGLTLDLARRAVRRHVERLTFVTVLLWEGDRVTPIGPAASWPPGSSFVLVVALTLQVASSPTCGSSACRAT